jgi:hypothetical protein
MSRYLVICPLEGMEQMAQSEWTRALRMLGHDVKCINLRSRGVDPRANLSNLVHQVSRFSPEAIFVEGLLGFNLPEFYLHPAIQDIPVIAFWFDDPYRSLSHIHKEDSFIELLRSKNIHHFVWDGYWRKWLKDKFGITSHPIHLAAHPEDFRPLPPQSEYLDHVVFVGTLIAGDKIQKIRDQFVPVTSLIAKKFDDEYPLAPYGSSPYLILEAMVKSLPPKWGNAYEMLSTKNVEGLKILATYCWMIGKNVTRRRVLKAVLKAAPLLVLSGNLEKSHAGENEFRELLGEKTSRLTYQDTSMMESKLMELYRYGKIHLQSTDPQSVEGGIPFRVFQTTACKKALITDKKIELEKCYKYGEEIQTYETDLDVPQKIEQIFKQSDLIDDLASSGHHRFLHEHTWTIRMQGVIEVLNNFKNNVNS